MSFIDILKEIVDGLNVTLMVFSLTLIFSIPLGLIVASIRKKGLINKILDLYILLMRGTPLLLQLMICYFGLPYINITLDRFTACFIAFILNYAAYFAEIYRGGIASIDVGQLEACKALGLSKFQGYRGVILPQAIRNTLPSVSNEVINLVKDTSLVYVLGISDILKNAKGLANTLGSLMPFVAVGIIYLLLIMFITRILNKIENSYKY